MNLLKSWTRHIILGVLALGLVYLFFISRSDWHPMHAWNRAFADVSLVYLMIIILLGPLAKLVKSVTRWLVWRRELGIWTGIMAFIHVLIILDGWVEWELFRFFYIFSPMLNEWVIHPGFALGNIVGIVGLIYVFLLMLVSNDYSIRKLGQKAWNYIQQRAHVYYLLVILHTFYFIFLHQPQTPNWIRVPFILLISGILLLQMIGFYLTIKREKIKGKRQK